MQVTVIGASSLHHAVNNPIFQLWPFENQVVTEPGMSLVNSNCLKNVHQVIRKRNWRTEQFILWHDVISNSISHHPTQSTQPLNPMQFRAELEHLATLNVVAFCYIPRPDAVFNVDDHLEPFTENIVFIKLRPLLSRHYRDLLAMNYFHVNLEVEHHFIQRVFGANNLHQLMLYKRINRNRSAQRRRHQGR